MNIGRVLMLIAVLITAVAGGLTGINPAWAAVIWIIWAIFMVLMLVFYFTRNRVPATVTGAGGAGTVVPAPAPVGRRRGFFPPPSPSGRGTAQYGYRASDTVWSIWNIVFLVIGGIVLLAALGMLLNAVTGTFASIPSFGINGNVLGIALLLILGTIMYFVTKQTWILGVMALAITLAIFGFASIPLLIGLAITGAILGYLLFESRGTFATWLLGIAFIILTWIAIGAFSGHKISLPSTSGGSHTTMPAPVTPTTAPTAPVTSSNPYHDPAHRSGNTR